MATVRPVRQSDQGTTYAADDHAAITLSGGGTSTGSVIDDATASVKDDLAVLGRKVNAVLACLKAHGLLNAS